MAKDDFLKWGKRPPTPPRPARPMADNTASQQRGPQGWGDILTAAPGKVIPELAADTWNGITGLPGNVAKVLDAYYGGPTDNPYLRAATHYSPLAWAGERVREGLGLPYHDPSRDPPVSKDAGIVAGLLPAYMRQTYTGPGAFKHTMETHPAQPVEDAFTAASTLEGGEGLAARIPGVAGDVARATVAAAKAVNRANPVSLAGQGVAAASKTAQRAIRGVPFDKTGNFTPAALQAVSAAFPNGEIGLQELADPRFKTVLGQTFRAKGVNPASVREAVLQYNGAPTSRSVITRQRVPTDIKGPVQDSIAEGKRTIAQRATDISGAPEPDPAALGNSLNGAYAATKARVDALYRSASSVPGTLDPSFKDIFGQNLQDALAAEHLPMTAEQNAAFPSHVQSQKAFDFLNDQISALADQNALTLPNLERARQELNALGSRATGNDGRVITNMRNALDQSVSDTLEHSVLQNGPIDYDASDFNGARQAFAAKSQNFENPKTANPSVRKAIRSAGTPQADLGADDDTSAPNAADVAAQNVLSRDLLQPSTLKVQPGAPKLYSDLTGILGDDGTSVLNDHLRQSILKVGDDGSLVASPAQIRSFIDSPLGTVFTPDEQTDLRLGAAGTDVLNSKLDYTAKTSAVDGLVHYGKALGAAGVGMVVGPMIPGLEHLPGNLAETLGAAGMGAAGYFVKPNLGLASPEARDLAGIPSKGGVLDLPANAGSSAAEIARAWPATRPVTAAINNQPTTSQSAPAPAANNPAPDASQRDYTALPTPIGDAAPALPAPVPKGHERDFLQWGVPVPATAPATAPLVVSPPPPSGSDIESYQGPYADEDDDSTDDRPQRASGGKVSDDIERLVTRLLTLAERAKRADKQSTKPLLGVSDRAIAQALRVAQSAL